MYCWHVQSLQALIAGTVTSGIDGRYSHNRYCWQVVTRGTDGRHSHYRYQWKAQSLQVPTIVHVAGQQQQITALFINCMNNTAIMLFSNNIVPTTLVISLKFDYI